MGVCKHQRRFRITPSPVNEKKDTFALNAHHRRTSMTRYGFIVTIGIVLLTGTGVRTANAQQGAAATPTAPAPYFVGNRLGMPINPAADGAFNAMTNNV